MKLLSIFRHFRFIVLFLISSCNYGNESYVGVYINQNFDYEPFIAEIPYKSDTLILKNDSTFVSGFFGKGTYQIRDNRITLRYMYDLGKASFEAPIEKINTENIRIILYRGQNHYYQKLK